MKAKKIIALVAGLAMCVGMLAACGGGGGKADKTYEVGVIQLVQHPALDEATKGFQDALEEKLGDNVKIDVQNASGDSQTCATIANQFVSDKKDLIMANATPALQAAVSATDSIPILGTSVTDYATALDIADWTGTTGINVSGTADLAPLEDQAKMIKELFPDAKTVGILYCSGEANSKYQADKMTEYLEGEGFTVNSFTFADSNDVASVTSTACAGSDVIFIPTDNTAASCVDTIDPIASAAKTPIVAGEENICKGCGVATLSISYYDLGYQTGLMAYDVLVEGKDPAEMEISYSEDLTKKYIKSRADAFGLTMPDDYEAIDESAE